MKHFYVLLLLIPFLFGSCGSEPLSPPPDPLAKTENPYHVSLEEINAIASEINLHGNLQPRSTLDSKNIESTTTVPDENNDALFYIINYRDNGFVIMPADNRIKPILAYSETSNFPTESTTDYPPGLISWLADTQAMLTHARDSIFKQSPLIKPLWDEPCDRYLLLPHQPPCDDYEPGCQDQITVKGPLIDTKWGQGLTYNNFCPNLGCTSYSNGRTPTGCVATAMAQVMKYYEYPVNYSWSNMPLAGGASETATLMHDAGLTVNMDYGCSASGASGSAMAPALKNDFGYSSASFSDYDYSTVKQQLNWGRPVILTGGREVTDFHFLGFHVSHLESGHLGV